MGMQVTKRCVYERSRLYAAKRLGVMRPLLQVQQAVCLSLLHTHIQECNPHTRTYTHMHTHIHTQLLRERDNTEYKYKLGFVGYGPEEVRTTQSIPCVAR